MTDELPHIRCLECGKPIAHLWNSYQEMLAAGVKPEQALTQLGLTRYCCRMWMQTPFKVPMRFDRQNDPLDTGLEQQATTLTMATGPQPALAPLQAMANPATVPRQTTTYTVVPLGGAEIGLPAIPEVPLPAIPERGTPAEQKKVTRIYEAW